ncbi:hypothetical protein ONE63_000029 [Megalurothrips usitatus]|uniref:Uncharacterized protein n=1 Tax=Megalurothrips usitatus TaxID=439358 RepID=A0AAV7Y3D3_9NEOP|nr:hypothetical protein ONE63_000029 [Megalurothrips usitatus]
MDVAFQNGRLRPPKQRLLRNGNMLGYNEIEGGNQVRVSNTCSFDSLCQASTEGYVQYPSYRAVIDASSNPFFKLCKSLAVNGAVAETYKRRASTLSTLLPVTGSGLPGIGPRRRRLVQLVYDCYEVLSDMAARVLDSIPSAKIKWRCEKGCVKEEIYQVLPVDVETIDSDGPGNIQAAVRRAVMMEPIKDGTSNPRAVHQSVIARQSPDHFVAVTRSSTGLWEVFNNLKRYPASADEDAKVCPVCLVYIKM